MNKTIPLSELFHVASRFHRSVHLERDFYSENALEGYVLTVTARETLQRVITALEDESTSKAWSLTGSLRFRKIGVCTLYREAAG